MDPRFLSHNSHLQHPDRFEEFDPQLQLLKLQPFVFTSELLKQLPTKQPGIYTLGGGRQIGKSTLLKQWMLQLLKAGIEPETIAFFSGELISDHQALFLLLQNQLAEMPQQKLHFIIIDEVSYIKQWGQTIKYAADAGLLRNVVVILTGSDLALIQEARMTFPGRRGKAAKVDFHLYPLSFYEAVQLKNAKLAHQLNQRTNDKITPTQLNALYLEFDQYLQHGGYLTAINELATDKAISAATLMTYSDWIRGDVIKRNKQEAYLREILLSISKHYGSQITWNTLAKSLSIDHPQTITEYVHLLQSMDCLFVQLALLEDKLVGAPKKARKVMFNDPFIFHAIRAWLQPTTDAYKTQILPMLAESAQCAKLVEACVITHFQRYYPTYYIKSEGEVDVAFLDQDRFWPIEIKWTTQLRANDLKQIGKYPNSRIWTRNQQPEKIFSIQAESLPLALFKEFQKLPNN